MISFITHPYHRGGVTAWIIDAVNFMAREEQEVRFICVQPRKPFISGSHRPLIADLIEDKKFKEGLPLVGISYELGTPNYRAWVLAKEILRNVPLGSTLIPSDDKACWMACAMLADRYRFLGVVHSDDPVHYQIFDRFYPYLSGIVTISNRISRNLPAVGLPILVAPCGIVLPPIPTRERQRYKLVYVGRLEEQQKRISDLIPMIALVRRSIPNIQLEIWGHGDAEVVLRAAIQAYGMENSVVLKGWGGREMILDALAEATVLVQVSNFEGMSIAVMEAMAMGCMVVSSEVSGVEDYARMEVGRDIIRLYPIGDRDAAAKAIIEALTVYDLDIAPKARAFAEKHFSIATCMQTYSAFADNLTINDGIQQMATPSIFDRNFSRVLACLRLLKYKIGL